MRKLILIGLVITGISGAAQASDTETNPVKAIPESSQKKQAPGFIEEGQAPLAEGLTEKEIKKRQENIRQQAESKELSRYWKFSSIFFGN